MRFRFSREICALQVSILISWTHGATSGEYQQQACRFGASAGYLAILESFLLVGYYSLDAAHLNGLELTRSK